MTALVQNGADGIKPSDDYMGFTFRATEAGISYDYEYALKGATTTTVVASRVAVNTPPTANAGPAQTVVSGAPVIMEGSESSDTEGAVTYLWAPVTAGAPTLSSLTEANPTFTAPTLAWNATAPVYTYRLTVTDTAGATATATVDITVTPPARVDLTAQAQLETVRTYRSGEEVVLTSTGTAGDPAGQLSYLWSSTNAAVIFGNPTSDGPGFIAPMVTAETQIPITLTVTETTPGATPPTKTASATFNVTVVPNAVPQAFFEGAPSTVIEGTVFQLATIILDDGRARSGLRQTSGPSAGLEGSLTPDGMGYTITAPFLAEGETEADMVFTLTVDDGVNPPVVKTLTITVTRDGPSAEVIGEEVAQFSQARMAALIANQPDLGGVLTGGDGTANLSVSSMGGTADLSTAPDQPFWLRLKGSWSNVAGADADYILGAAGTHIKVSEGLALGVMAQVDHMESVDGLSLATGTGWLVGPYVVAKLPQHPLTVQGRLLFGRTANSLAPVGTYADTFGGTRLLGQLGLSGEVVKGAVTWRPSLQAAYVRETTDAYTDTMGNDIAAQESAIAQVAAGLDASFPVQVASGTMTATVGVADVWAATLQGADAAFEGHRGRITAGVNRSFANGAAVSLTASYDGIGTPAYESIGLDLLFQHRF